MSECPVRINYQKALSSAQEFSRALRKLRRSLRHCKRCASRETCPIRQQFNQAIDLAAREVTEEWGLRVEG